MKDGINFKENFGVQIIRNGNQVADRLDPRGVFRLEHIRNGKVINLFEWKNTITLAGRNLLLDVMFGATAKSATWYMGLISGVAFSAISASDTMATHGGWTEFTTITQATRPAWTPGAASSQAITNGTAMQFDTNASGTIVGAFVINQNTKGGTTGTLWSAGQFGATLTVGSSDTIRNTYSLND